METTVDAGRAVASTSPKSTELHSGDCNVFFKLLILAGLISQFEQHTRWNFKAYTTTQPSKSFSCAAVANGRGNETNIRNNLLQTFSSNTITYEETINLLMNLGLEIIAQNKGVECVYRHHEDPSEQRNYHPDHFYRNPKIH
jgi:hypothetical protein